MKIKTVNPWEWQNNLGYAQGVEIMNNAGTLYCAGQTAVDDKGIPVEGTMEEQLLLSLKNIEKVVHMASYDLSNIVRLNLYTTSIPDFFAAYGTLAVWLNVNGAMPSSTLLEVSALAYPELKVEIEATVVK